VTSAVAAEARAATITPVGARLPKRTPPSTARPLRLRHRCRDQGDPRRAHPLLHDPDASPEHPARAAALLHANRDARAIHEVGSRRGDLPAWTEGAADVDHAAGRACGRHHEGTAPVEDDVPRDLP
jgi:hypothetical protein